MGSLMPGWNSNAPGVPPKELRDYDDHAVQPREGYFSKLQKSKSLKRDSSPAKDQTTDAPLTGQLSHSPPVASTDAPLSARNLQRSSTLPEQYSDSLPVPGRSFSKSRAATTGSPAPSSPRTPKSPLGRKSVPLTGAELRREEEKRKDAIHKPFQWWRKFSSSRLNEMPDTGAPSNWRGSPYVPQYSVTGQKMQYIGTQATTSTADDKDSGDSPKAPETPPAASASPGPHAPTANFVSVH